MESVVECAVASVLIGAYCALLGWLLGGAVGLGVGCGTAALVVHLALPTVREAISKDKGLDRL